MFRSTGAGIDASAYEYDARYQPQPTEDRQDGAERKVRRQSGKRPDYRPTPLRWYFVLVQILALLALMGLVVWARQAMPNSDSSATIKNQKRWTTGNESVAVDAAPLPVQITTTVVLDAKHAAQELRRAAEEFELQPRQTPSPNAAPAASNAGGNAPPTVKDNGGSSGNTNPPAPPPAAPPTTAAAPPPAATTAGGGNANTVAATQAKANDPVPTTPAGGNANTVASEPKAKEAPPTTAGGGNANTVAATQAKANDPVPTTPAGGNANTVASEPKAKDPPPTTAAAAGSKANDPPPAASAPAVAPKPTDIGKEAVATTVPAPAPAASGPSKGDGAGVTTPAGGSPAPKSNDAGITTAANPGPASKGKDAGITATPSGGASKGNDAGISTPAGGSAGPKSNEAGITSAPSAGPASKGNSAGVSTPDGSAGPKSNEAGISTPGGSAGPKSNEAGISTPGGSAGPASKDNSAGVSTPGGSAGPASKDNSAGVSTPGGSAGPKTKDNSAGISTPGGSAGPKTGESGISTPGPTGGDKSKGASVTTPSDSKETGVTSKELPAGKGRVVTTLITTKISMTVTGPSSKSSYTTTVGSTVYSTSYYSSGDVEGTTYTSKYTSKITTKSRMTTVITQSSSVVVGVTTKTSTAYSIESDVPDNKPPKSIAYDVEVTETYTQTYGGGVITTAKDVPQEYTITGSTVITEDGHGGAGATGGYTVVPVATTRVTSTGVVTVPGDTFIQLGTTVITSVYTEAPRGKGNNDNSNKNGENGNGSDAPKGTPSEKVIQVVSEKPDETVKQVKTLEPTVIVATLDGQVETLVWSQPAETIVTSLPAYVTTIAVVTTGWDGLLTTSQVVSTVSGGLTTIVTTPGPTTFTTTRSGMLTTFTSDRGLTTVLSTIKGTTQTLSSTTTIMPTAVSTDVPGTVKETTRVIGITEAGYFIGKFLPTMLSVLLSIPLRIIDLNAQLYQPFYAMNRPQGAFGADSMILHYSGFIGFIKPIQNFWDGHPVPFITMLIVWCSALMTPLSAVAIGVKIHGSCSLTNPKGCGAALGVSPTSTHALLALMGFTIVLLCALMWYLRNWETGLHANPWSIVGISSLATNRDIRPQKLTQRKIDREMAEKKYGFGYFQTRDGQTEYGIVFYDEVGENLNSLDGNVSDASSIEVMTQTRRRRNPFMALGWGWRLAFLLFLLGVAILVLYYHIEKDNATAFKRFMNGQSFWVRFLFPSVGVIIIFAWTTFFISVAMIVPYKNMAQDPQAPSDSILITRPTNGFSGIVAAIKHNQIYPGIVAVMTILAEFMPILLTNIPYTITQTYTTHVVCARISISILLLMVITVVGSFFIKWPHMPVDPRSIAGAMYYVSESHMVDQFSGLASCDKHERARRVKEMGGRYWFGEIVGKNGQHRLAVEREDDSLGTDQGFGSFPRQQMGHNRQQESVDSTYYGYQADVSTPLSPPPMQQQQQQQQHYQEPYTDVTANHGYYTYQPEPTSPLSPQQQQPHQEHQIIDTSYHGYQPEPSVPLSPRSPHQQPAQLVHQTFDPGYYGHQQQH